MTNLPAEPVDAHDPAGMAAFMRERAKANREIAELPREQWPYRPAVLQHWALRFEQCAELIERLELLARFGAWCFDSHRGDMNEPGDVDGGSIQDELVRLGLLEAREVTEPCGPQCICGPSVKSPETCYFTAPGVRDLIGALTRRGEP